MEIAVLTAVRRELEVILAGARLIELAEGEAGEVCFTFRTAGGKRTLLMSPRPDMPRVYLTGKGACTAKKMSPFAQSLKNSVVGATLASVTQEPLERVVGFHFTRNTRAGEEEYTLVFELTGKKPDLILVDKDGRVVLAQTYVSISDEAVRPILPGLTYQPPPKPDRLDPHALTVDDIARILMDNPGVRLDKALFMSIGGISPLIASEAVALAGVQSPTPHVIARSAPPASGDDAAISSTLLENLNALVKKAEDGPYAPCVYDTPKGPVLSAFELVQYAGCAVTEYPTMGEAADAYYAELVERRKSDAQKASLLKKAKTSLALAARKLAAIEADLARADSAETYQMYGQLLMATPGDMPRGAECITMPDLFSGTGGTLDVPVDPRLTRVQNAESWFKKAKKAKSGVAILQGRLAEAQREAERLKARLIEIEGASGEDVLAGLKEQSSTTGKVFKDGRRPKGTLPDFPHFTSSDGYEVYYAKNAKANDLLTFKFAEPMDMWMHAQGWHGAHVIVKNPGRRPDIPLQTILEAAEVAAWFSNAREDSSVPVDYTFKKYVRKPKGPSPGQAVFTGNKTVFVGPKKR